ncbi:hypothetical protein B566_EDAN014710 [Ephemera danica]|nr:hypothetical protein B566_EDAN014710 [Ephemera danica]
MLIIMSTSNIKHDATENHTSPSAIDDEYTVYQRRWIVLILYVLFCICNAMQWIQYAIISDIIMTYYDVTLSAVVWTSAVWMLVYIILVLPATWLLNNKGLRFVLILGQVCNCLGAWIKVVSATSPDLFWLTFIGQTVVSTAQVYVMSTPAAVAATWFGPKQVSTACAIGVFGFMIGNGLGSLIPPLMVKKHEGEFDQIHEIGNDLSVMFYTVAGFATVLLVLLIVFLEDRPPRPPSAAQANRCHRAGIDLGGETPREFVQAIRRVLRNRNFFYLVIAYGMMVGVFSAIMTFLNQMILEHHYQNGMVFAGNIGATFIIFGLIGAIFVGIILDRTHKYKETCFVLYIMACVGSIGLTLLLSFECPKYSIYMVAAVIGFFMIGYLPSGYEFGAELTYPEAEATSAGVLSLSTQVFAFLFTLIYSVIFHGDQGNDSASNGAM